MERLVTHKETPLNTIEIKVKLNTLNPLVFKEAKSTIILLDWHFPLSFFYSPQTLILYLKILRTYNVTFNLCA